MKHPAEETNKAPRLLVQQNIKKLHTYFEQPHLLAQITHLLLLIFGLCFRTENNGKNIFYKEATHISLVVLYPNSGLYLDYQTLMQHILRIWKAQMWVMHTFVLKYVSGFSSARVVERDGTPEITAANYCNLLRRVIRLET